MTPSRAAASAAALAVLALGLVACGDDDGDPSGSPDLEPTSDATSSAATSEPPSEGPEPIPSRYPDVGLEYDRHGPLTHSRAKRFGRLFWSSNSYSVRRSSRSLRSRLSRFAHSLSLVFRRPSRAATG